VCAGWVFNVGGVLLEKKCQGVGRIMIVVLLLLGKSTTFIDFQ
jgi:hypothetical protein